MYIDVNNNYNNMNSLVILSRLTCLQIKTSTVAQLVVPFSRFFSSVCSSCLISSSSKWLLTVHFYMLEAVSTQVVMTVSNRFLLYVYLCYTYKHPISLLSFASCLQRISFGTFPSTRWSTRPNHHILCCLRLI